MAVTRPCKQRNSWIFFSLPFCQAQKYAEAEGIILKERGMREQADATCKELTISSGAIREINERLKKETEEAVASARIAQQENVRLYERRATFSPTLFYG